MHRDQFGHVRANYLSSGTKSSQVNMPAHVLYVTRRAETHEEILHRGDAKNKALPHYTRLRFFIPANTSVGF
jgi:hypothetical protein